MLRRALQRVATCPERSFCSPAVAQLNNPIPQLPNDRQFLLDTAQVTVPSFEVGRRFGNLFAQSFYTMFYERNFSVESLVHGANKGIHSMAHFVANENWDQMENLAVKDTVETLRTSRSGISGRLEAALRFNPDDIVLSFLHSTLISGKDVLKLSKTRNIGIYFTVVSYVRLSKKVPENVSISELNGKFKNDVLVCNATFSRVLNPLGVWKVTNANFFLPN